MIVECASHRRIEFIAREAELLVELLRNAVSFEHFEGELAAAARFRDFFDVSEEPLGDALALKSGTDGVLVRKVSNMPPFFRRCA